MAEAENKNNRLGVIFTAAVVGLATGFATEFFTFPFYHYSELGQGLANISLNLFGWFYDGLSAIFMPSVDAISSSLGIVETTTAFTEQGAPIIEGTDALTMDDLFGPS